MPIFWKLTCVKSFQREPEDIELRSESEEFVGLPEEQGAQ